ncbi:MAG: cytochrome b/b6 domain-containing protein [Candidatus Thiothrix singaporensis]|uniref:Cytochrome b/b6 domain-containing protein n=1 Tax=Candidatus Thiothrix singaporensis TaxID=2799669 RepID=A0A7L6ANJ8_9GAMM|nr:MAG: cytochrome b/b6 domain-containing protein [Candidatus Thiothrix singaporensis]
MESNQVKVWDPLVRIFHWSLVLAFAAAYLTGEEWDDWEEVHEFAGYAAVGLILFRIVWGFVGSQYARFSDFLYGPKTVIEYLKSLLTTHPKHYLGHNPAGGWMVMLLLAGVLVTGVTGLKLLGLKEGEGPFAKLETPALVSVAHADRERDADEDEGQEQPAGMAANQDDVHFWKEIHETASNLTLALVIIHVLGVIVSSRLHRENLARAMVTGKKQLP